MKFFQYILVASLICIFFLQSGCSNKDKWKAVPLQITKRESFNYSEMISGELDSTEKADLEAAKEKTKREIKNNPEQISEKSAKSNSKETSLINKVWQGIKNIYNWFINLF